MNQNEQFEVLIIGGSYSGLAAAMALGRSLRKVLVIDEGMPCNRQTPYSHNFLTQDGHTPAEIASLGRRQVEEYSTVRFLEGRAVQQREAVHCRKVGFCRRDKGHSAEHRRVCFLLGYFYIALSLLSWL